jgi:hypothetical protein
MHNQAVQKIKKHIKGTLRNCYVEDSRLEYKSFFKHAESLGKEILKHKKEWIDLFDVYIIFIELVHEAIKNKFGSDRSLKGNLWDILGEEEGQKLTESIKSYFISIPRTYDIYIPIPNVSEIPAKKINLNNDISLIVFDDAKQVPGGYNKGIRGIFSGQLELNKLYYKQRLTGYCGVRLENVSLKRAINNLKILLHQGIYRRLFKVSPADKVSVGLHRLMLHYQIPKFSVISVDITSKSNEPKNAELPLDFSKLLNNISFDFENELLAKAKENKSVFKTAIVALLKEAIELIKCEEEESKRVKSAVQWCFDSYIVENRTLAFLQVCIGLEALLGDDSSSGSLVKTLADRCSYLVGDDIKSRKKIKESFEDLYDVRSNIVHGNVIELDSDQEGLFIWGRKILEYAISKEIKHLNLEKT